MDARSSQLRYASFLTILIAVAFVLTARVVYLYVAAPQRFPINTVKISASYQHISHKKLESLLANYLDSSFFTLPVRRLYNDLSSLDWANKVQIERIWPDILKITLIEKIPFATWNKGMLTEEGEIFNEGGELTDFPLPHLSGPANQEKEVLQVYKKMSKILSIYGLHASDLEWRDNHAWELKLTNGLQLHLGKQDLDTRVTRFCKAYPAVFAERAELLASVDLRYPRGMAVQWKK